MDANLTDIQSFVIEQDKYKELESDILNLLKILKHTLPKDKLHLLFSLEEKINEQQAFIYENLFDEFIEISHKKIVQAL